MGIGLKLNQNSTFDLPPPSLPSPMQIQRSFHSNIVVGGIRPYLFCFQRVGENLVNHMHVILGCFLIRTFNETNHTVETSCVFTWPTSVCLELFNLSIIITNNQHKILTSNLLLVHSLLNLITFPLEHDQHNNYFGLF